MRMVDIIEKKRDGKELTKQEIDYFIRGYTDGEIPDYQASALAMAILFREMTDKERGYLTMAMVESGDQIDLSKISGIKVDKHSTGGVGDTTTLILAPLIASLGIPVAKMSGRGLGHTGGTIDKLESIPGFNIEITNDEFIAAVIDNNIALVGQTGNLTPADKKLYALRDVTGSVNSLSLIAASIMSKKIASGADAIVLDVKYGAGAFMKTYDDAVRLAEAMVKIGDETGRKTVAIISNMSQPLGLAIGNSLEVQEAIDVLRGKGPDDLRELVLALGSQMVLLGGKTDNLEQARLMLEEAIDSGRALSKFREFIKRQGGDPRVVDDYKLLPQARYVTELPALESGVVGEILADEIGVAAMQLGAGRMSKEDKIDLAVGIVLNKKIGDHVEKGETLVTVYSNEENIEDITEKIYNSIRVKNRAERHQLIRGIITS